MNDMTFPDELDELASAYLDGAATAAERARVEADPALLARVEVLRSVSVHLNVVGPADTERRDRAIMSALAVFDQQGVGSDPAHAVDSVADPRATVHHLHELRARRTRRLAPVLGIAAASVLLAGVGLVAMNQGDDGSPSADNSPRIEISATSLDPGTQRKVGSPEPVEDAGADGDVEAAGAGTLAVANATPVPEQIPMTAADDSADIEAAAPVGDDVMADVFTTVAPIEITSGDQAWALVTEIAARAGQQGESPATLALCPDAPGVPAADVTWLGRPAVLYVTPDLAGAESATVLDAATCEPLALFPAA